MNCSKHVFFVFALFVSSSLLLADNDEKKQTAVDLILEELRELRQSVQRIEKRIDRLEKKLENFNSPQKTAKSVRRKPSEWSDERPMTLDEWHRHEMPWKSDIPKIDTGLYVFPLPASHFRGKPK